MEIDESQRIYTYNARRQSRPGLAVAPCKHFTIIPISNQLEPALQNDCDLHREVSIIKTISIHQSDHDLRNEILRFYYA
jgi:hypothetical protein